MENTKLKTNRDEITEKASVIDLKPKKPKNDDTDTVIAMLAALSTRSTLVSNLLTNVINPLLQQRLDISNECTKELQDKAAALNAISKGFDPLNNEFTNSSEVTQEQAQVYTEQAQGIEMQMMGVNTDIQGISSKNNTNSQREQLLTDSESTYINGIKLTQDARKNLMNNLIAVTNTFTN